jgi:preprotein translocase subunit SecE
MSSITSRRVSQGASLQAKIIRAFYFVATLIVAVLYSKIIAAGFSWFALKDPAVLGRDFTMSTVYALAFTVLTLWWVLRSPLYRSFINEVAQELVKVSWPTFDESKLQTMITIIVTLIIAAILYVFDLTFGGLTDLLLSI